MSDTTISADDLAMCRTAQQQAMRAQQAMNQAQQQLAQAQTAFAEAMGAFRFSAAVALERKGYPPTATFSLETGEINGNGAGAKAPEVSPEYVQGRWDAEAAHVANGKPWPPPLDRHVLSKAREKARKKGA